jgi:hypothetical protein
MSNRKTPKSARKDTKPAQTWVCRNPECAKRDGGEVACVYTIRTKNPLTPVDPPITCPRLRQVTGMWEVV